jgi:hypothetical protein
LVKLEDSIVQQESGIRKQQTAIYLMDFLFASHFHVSRCVVPGTRNSKKADSRNANCSEEECRGKRTSINCCVHEKLAGDEGDDVIISALLGNRRAP